MSSGNPIVDTIVGVVTGGPVMGALALAQGVMAMSEADSAKKRARGQNDLAQAQIAEQKKQAAETARMNQIKSARAARLQSARIAGAVAGAGVSGGVLDMPLADLNTSLDTTFSDIDKNLASQNTQFGIASSQADLRAKMAVDSANAQMWKGLFGATKDIVTNPWVRDLGSETFKSSGLPTTDEWNKVQTNYNNAQSLMGEMDFADWVNYDSYLAGETTTRGNVPMYGGS